MNELPAPPAAHKVYQPRPLAALARVFVALACFVATLAGLRALAAPGGGSVIGGKLEYWRAHAAEYDTVFLGTSHVFRACLPSEFDAATAGFGKPTRSFNFGVQGVHLLEQRYLLGEILDAQPHLARVFFEYQWLTPELDPQNAFDPRTVYWHDRESTMLAIARALHWQHELGDGLAFVEAENERHSIFTALERPFSSGERIALQHGQHYLTELFSIGRGKDVLRGILGRESGQTARYRAQQGYVSLEEDDRVLAAQGDVHNSYRARRERFLAEPAAYHAAVDRLDAEEQSFGDAEWVNADLTRVDDFELIAEIARATAARGVEFVLVILPSQSANRPFEERLVEELGALVLRYNLPERYPDLYDPRQRWDSGHLSESGARFFSRLLARDYVFQSGVPREGQRDPEPLDEGAPQ
jgi:hypothetical protein